MDTHAFTPSRQDGIVCVARRRGPSGLGDVEACGYPLGHPIHVVANTPAEARVGISDRNAAALTAVAELGRTLHATGVDPAWFESRLRLIEQALLRGER